MKYLKPVIFFIFLLGSTFLFSQTNNIQDFTSHVIEIHFKTGMSEVKETKNIDWSFLQTALQNHDSFVIKISGYADNLGSIKGNQKLSLKRANALQQYLLNNYKIENEITTLGFGATNFIASNNTAKGRFQNRRVVFECVVYKKEKPKPIIEAEKVAIKSNIQELYNLLATPMQSFCIDPNKDTILVCKKGTIIYLKANSIALNSNIGNCVTFNVKEDFLSSEMIMDNLTTTSNGELLQTQGMIYTEALDKSGNKLELLKGKDFVVMMPTDSVNPNTRLFDGF